MKKKKEKTKQNKKKTTKKKQKKKNSPPVPHLLQAQQAPALPYAKVVGRPGTAHYLSSDCVLILICMCTIT